MSEATASAKAPQTVSSTIRSTTESWNKACTRSKNNIRMHVIMDQLYKEFGRISQKYDFTSFVDDMSEYADKKMQEFTVEKHELLGQKT